MSQFLLYFILWLPVKEDVYIDSFSGIDQKGEPACTDLGAVAAGRDQKISVIDSIHDTVVSMGKINAFRGKKLSGRNMIQVVFASGIDILTDYLIDSGRQRFYGTGTAVQQVIENIRGKFIFVIRHQDFISALLKIGFRCLNSGCQGRAGIAFVCVPTSVKWFIFKNNKKTTGYGFL